MGARVERGRALRYRACAQDLTGNFGGAVHPADLPDLPEVVACPAGRTLPSTRAGGQDDVSYTKSLKKTTHTNATKTENVALLSHITFSSDYYTPHIIVSFRHFWI